MTDTLLIDAVLSGERRALARAITLIESTRSDHHVEANRLLEALMPHTGNSIRVGISGAPGVGKSTFIEALGNHVIDQGHKVAVLTVDPSSAISGGSILGDKTRMETLARRPEAYVRPSPSGNTLGGVTRRSRETLLLCEAAGFDVIFVETVGVGQSETRVAEMTDMFVLLLQPGAGDELQGIKRGIMELADLVLINKADGPLKRIAEESSVEFRNALRLLRPRIEGWKVPVQTCSSLERDGIDEAWKAVLRGRCGQVVALGAAVVDGDLDGAVEDRPASAGVSLLASGVVDLLEHAGYGEEEGRLERGEVLYQGGCVGDVAEAQTGSRGGELDHPGPARRVAAQSPQRGQHLEDQQMLVAQQGRRAGARRSGTRPSGSAARRRCFACARSCSAGRRRRS